MWLMSNIGQSTVTFDKSSTESSAGGTLLYKADHLSYKNCGELNIFTKNIN